MTVISLLTTKTLNNKYRRIINELRALCNLIQQNTRPFKEIVRGAHCTGTPLLIYSCLTSPCQSMLLVASVHLTRNTVTPTRSYIYNIRKYSGTTNIFDNALTNTNRNWNIRPTINSPSRQIRPYIKSKLFVRSPK